MPVTHVEPDTSWIGMMRVTDPVAWWRVGESAGTNAVDATDNRIDATYVGGAGVTKGIIGAVLDDPDTAITLDGATGYLEVANSTEQTHPLNLTNQVSVGCWAKFAAGANGVLITHGGSNPATTIGYLLMVDVGIVRFYTCTAAGVFTAASSPYAIADGLWHLYVGTYDGGVTRLYIDGILAMSSAVVTGFLRDTFGLPVRIGRYSDAGGWFTGSIDEPAIWNRPLNATEIANLFGSSQVSAGAVVKLGPTTFYRMNDQAGVTVVDHMRANNGTLSGGYTLGVNGPVPYGEYAIQFNDVNGRIVIAPPATTTTYTFAFWIKPDSTQTALYGPIVCAGANGIFYKSGIKKISLWYSGADHFNANALTDGEWVYVVISVDLGNVAFYINGVVDNGYAGAISFGPSEMGTSGANVLKGTLDEFAYWSGRALNAAEIAALYVNQSQAPWPYFVKRLKPAGWWRLDDPAGTAVAKDSASGGTDGVVSGGAAFSLTGAPINELSNRSAWFDGGTGRIAITKDYTVHNGAIAIAAWVNPSNASGGFGGHKMVLSFTNGVSYLSVNGLSVTISVEIGGVQRVQTSGALALDVWTFVVGTWDGDKLRVYLNGVLSNGASASYVGVTNLRNGTHYIGHYAAGGLDYIGLIDEVMLIGRALTAQEIAQLYASRNTSIPVGFSGLADQYQTDVDRITILDWKKNHRHPAWLIAQWTNRTGEAWAIPYARTELYASVNLRTKYSFQYASHVRLVATNLRPGGAGILSVQYSADNGSTWGSLDGLGGPSVNVKRYTIADSGWIALAAALMTSATVILRIVGEFGEAKPGVPNPTETVVGWIGVYVK